jgi:hypothetical protein
MSGDDDGGLTSLPDQKGTSMKWILAYPLIAMTALAASATALASDTPSAIVAAEPLFLTGSLAISAYNLYSIENPSLLWSGLGMAVGTLTLALSAADSAAIPVADAVLGAVSFFVGLARFPRGEAVHAHGRAVGFEVDWCSARVVARF